MYKYYKNKKIVIVGFGLTGLSCLNFFLSIGIYPKIVDEKKNNENIKFIPFNIKYCFGYLNSNWILNSDLIVISPGISSYNKVILCAKKKGIEIINDIEIFFREVKGYFIVVTGTNGKTTVVSLLFNIMKKSGFNVLLGGNIGIPVLSLINKKSDFYILELSSFQLEYCYSINSLCSVILNIDYDHLDRYPYGIHDYVFSKLNIFNNSQYCFFNLFNKFSIPYNYFEKNIITFGFKKSDYYISKKNNNLFLFNKGKIILDVKNLKIRGIFNYINLLSVIAISDFLGIKRNILLNIICKFKGLPHRFSFIKYNKGILWINDSKSTNISSTISALKSLYNIKGIIWLLLGGDTKSVNFNILLKPFLLKYKNLRICCYGKDRNLLFNLVPSISNKFIYMSSAVFFILKYINYGDVILLSPACSSLDQFINFEQRGNEFIKLSKKYG